MITGSPTASEVLYGILLISLIVFSIAFIAHLLAEVLYGIDQLLHRNDEGKNGEQK